MYYPASSHQPLELITQTDLGLHCELGGFTIDPWHPCKVALITHAHADHARPVAEVYYASQASVPLLKHRLGDIDVRGVKFGETINLGATQVSFHPAGHVLGSSQIRVRYQEVIWVVTGDFKLAEDPTCEPFELVPCNTLITEATFALPVFRWQPGRDVAKEIYEWWCEMVISNRPAVLFAYSLGKAQRVLSELSVLTDKTVYLHGAISPITDIYRRAGINMLPTLPIDLDNKSIDYRGQLIIAPPSASGSAWMKRFPNASTGFCSGWMRIRGNRRRKGHDRGFILSDHADWDSLLKTIKQTGATRIITTHGRSETLVKYLKHIGYQAEELSTPYDNDETSANHTEGSQNTHSSDY